MTSLARIEDFEVGQHAPARHRLEMDAWIENEAGERVIEGVCEAGLLPLE
ncbi:MAG TPA: hypothetical protein VE007_03990 [Thermoanaerobaculia bacterium]|nr:hypothetical protein [Thermoanaerobaculia bacterium]